MREVSDVMWRLTLLACLLLPASLHADRAPHNEEKGTYLGALFCPVPEALYDHLPQLARNQGVLVTHILPESPASRADLRRHDILLRYDDKPIRDCEHFARLIQNDKPENKVKLTLLRSGRETTASVTLGLGPILKIASKDSSAPRTTPTIPRGIAKPGGPATVSLAATPLENGQLKVIIEYYDVEKRQTQTVTCQAAAADVENVVRKKLPSRERQYVEVALKRLRDLKFLETAPPQPHP